MRAGSVAEAAVLGVLAACLGAGACGAKARGAPACGDGVQLAIVGEVAIGWRDVRQAQGQVKVLGGELSDRDALIDVLWQEAGRQKLELPGGTEIYKSRRSVVRQYKSAGEGRRDDKPEFNAGQVPADARMTPCGDRVLKYGG